MPIRKASYCPNSGEFKGKLRQKMNTAVQNLNNLFYLYIFRLITHNLQLHRLPTIRRLHRCIIDLHQLANLLRLDGEFRILI